MFAYDHVIKNYVYFHVRVFERILCRMGDPKQKIVLVTGGTGLVGQAIQKVSIVYKELFRS